MSELVIQVQHLSKVYHLGRIAAGSFRQDLKRWWMNSVQKRETPFFQNDARVLHALKDVSFEVKSGEVCGLIGANGSGKSTLLKIISRITAPSSGIVRGKGKISSLLETGTGFHPELTGRENIYLSGYILGMSKKDIRKRSDEIIAFAAVEKFIDTPVKRYSSGMFARLSLSVGIHLEPDILLLDEVMVVNDTEFQKKCLARLRQVSGNDGRTILMVSHNLELISQVCSRALWLDKGRLMAAGPVSSVVNEYVNNVAS